MNLISQQQRHNHISIKQLTSQPVYPSKQTRKSPKANKQVQTYICTSSINIYIYIRLVSGEPAWRLQHGRKSGKARLRTWQEHKRQKIYFKIGPLELSTVLTWLFTSCSRQLKFAISILKRLKYKKQNYKINILTGSFSQWWSASSAISETRLTVRQGQALTWLTQIRDWWYKSTFTIGLWDPHLDKYLDLDMTIYSQEF